MHPSTHAAFALLLLAAQGAQAQAPLPAGFVDAAGVAGGLVVDMRYFGANNFVGERIDGYERPRCLLSAMQGGHHQFGLPQRIGASSCAAFKGARPIWLRGGR
jgi:hypothetical protein